MRNFALAVREKVRPKRASNSATSGVSRTWMLMGLKPPNSSETSVCWLRFWTRSEMPRQEAMYCSAVVFPVPVSPMRRSGSARLRASTISWARRRKFEVRAKGGVGSGLATGVRVSGPM